MRSRILFLTLLAVSIFASLPLSRAEATQVNLLVDSSYGTHNARSYAAKLQDYIASLPGRKILVSSVDRRIALTDLRLKDWTIAVLPTETIRASKDERHVRFAVYDMPFAFRTTKDLRTFQAGEPGRIALAGLSDEHIIPIDYLNAGIVHIVANAGQGNTPFASVKREPIAAAPELEGSLKSIGLTTLPFRFPLLSAEKARLENSLANQQITFAGITTGKPAQWLFLNGRKLPSGVDAKVFVVVAKRDKWDQLSPLEQNTITGAVRSISKAEDFRLGDMDDIMLANFRVEPEEERSSKDFIQASRDNWLKAQPEHFHEFLFDSTKWIERNLQIKLHPSRADNQGRVRRTQFETGIDPGGGGSSEVRKRSGSLSGSIFFVTNRPAKLDEVQSPAREEVSSILANHFGSIYTSEVMCGEAEYDAMITTGGTIEFDWVGLKIWGITASHCAHEVVWFHEGRASVNLFIHGYNNGFEAALSRAATMRASIGEPVTAWVWPSKGKVGDYYGDFRVVVDSFSPFREFIREVARISNAEGPLLNLIGHSMGSQLVLDGTRYLSVLAPSVTAGKIVMAAPNVNPTKIDELFDVLRAGRTPSLYVCPNDWVLKHLAGKEHRAGLGGQIDVLVHPRLDTIDVQCRSLIGAGVNPELSHSYFFSEPRVRSDFAAALGGKRPWLRGLLERPKGGGRYWIMRF